MDPEAAAAAGIDPSSMRHKAGDHPVSQQLLNLGTLAGDNFEGDDLSVFTGTQRGIR